MRREWIGACAVVVLLVTGTIPAAYAGLERVGPTVSENGYPAWYQDKTGLVLEFCQPQNQAELDGGWCLLVAGDTSVPEVFPSPFADEHFYWAADAGIDFTENNVTSNALLVLGLEAAFAQDAVVPGDQIVFGRIRVRINDLPYSGTYTIYHPFGVWVFPDQVAGDRLFATEDIGFNCPLGQFDCALDSNLGPFLLPSATPGGAEIAAISGPVPGKLYIADPAREGPVTGSPLGTFLDENGDETFHNIFRIVHAETGWAIETTDFTLMGRIFGGTIPARVNVNRASYASDTGGNKLDVHANAFPAALSRLPANEKPAEITPVLSFFNAPCTPTLDGEGNPGPPYSAPPNETDVQMFSAGSVYWGQSQPPAVPLEVCVEDETARDANGQVVPAFFPAVVTDQVTITSAVYDPSNGGTLSVTASSSDAVNLPELTLSWTGMPDSLVIPGQPGTAAFSVTPLAAPPAKVRVRSAEGGLNEYQVTTGIGAPSGGNVPVAANDSAETDEDTSVVIDVLANDTLNGSAIDRNAATVDILGAMLGSAVVDLDPASANFKNILYTPNPDVNGTDGIVYTVTVNGLTSSPAYVTIVIHPVNDPPVAVDDAVSGVAGIPQTINVLANDTDPDGQANLDNAVNVTQPTPTGASVSGDAGGVVTFTATAAGTYSFTYQAQDAAGVVSSNTATVTVTVAAEETIVVQQAEFRTRQRRWRVSGTDSVQAGQVLRVTYANGKWADFEIGTAVVIADGTWAIDLRGVTGISDPTDPIHEGNPPTDIRVTSDLSGASRTAPINIRN